MKNLILSYILFFLPIYGSSQLSLLVEESPFGDQNEMDVIFNQYNPATQSYSHDAYYLPTFINGERTNFSLSLDIFGNFSELDNQVIFELHEINTPALVLQETIDIVGGHVNFILESELFSPGVYKIIIREMDNDMYEWEYEFTENFIVLENVKRFETDDDFLCSIRWIDYFFDPYFDSNNYEINPIFPEEVFTEYTQTAMNMLWDKLITDWDLCYATPEDVGRLYDDDGHLNIYLISVRDDLSHPLLSYFIYRDEINTQAEVGSQKHISYNIFGGSYYNSAKEELFSSLSHEFYHLIQGSYNNEPYPYYEYAWLWEGQAQFIQTVFMKYYTEAYQDDETTENPEFLINNFGNYINVVNDLIKEKDQLAKPMTDYSGWSIYVYGYAVYWRMLYEDYKSIYYSEDDEVNDYTIKEKLRIIIDCFNDIETNRLIQISEKFDDVLNQGDGEFSSTAELFNSFYYQLYFNKVSDDNWKPNALYQNLPIIQTAEFEEFGITLPLPNNSPPVSNTLYPYSLQLFSINFSDLYKIKVDFSDKENSGDFYTLNIHEDAARNTIKEYILRPDYPSVQFNIENTNEKVKVLVARIAANNDDSKLYKLEIMPNGQATESGLDFTAVKKNPTDDNDITYILSLISGFDPVVINWKVNGQDAGTAMTVEYNLDQTINTIELTAQFDDFSEKTNTKQITLYGYTN